MLRLRRVVVAGGRQRTEPKKNECFDVELISNTSRSIGGEGAERRGNRQREKETEKKKKVVSRDNCPAALTEMEMMRARSC